MAGKGVSQRAWQSLARMDGDELGNLVELGIRFLNEDDGTEIGWVGGTYDRSANRYIERRSDQVIEIRLFGNQVHVMEDFLFWLDYNIRLRRILSLYPNRASWANKLAWKGQEPLYRIDLAGGRRGGKSRIAQFCILAACVAIPGLRAAIFCQDSKGYEEMIEKLDPALPRQWMTWKASESKYILVNGSVIELHSGSGRDAKIGELGIVMINEGQEIKRKIAAQITANAADKGGLTVMTYNPPTRLLGKWVVDHWNMITGEGPNPDGIKFAAGYHFSGLDNPHVVKESLEAQLITGSENEYRREILGDMNAPMDNVVFPTFDAKQNVIPAIYPEWKDVTSEVSEQFFGHHAKWIGGLDFGRGAGCSWVLGRFYLEPGSENLDEATFAIHCGKREKGAQEKEWHSLADTFMDEYGNLAIQETDEVVWVGDGSGTWQNADHDKARPPSWEILQALDSKYILVGPKPGNPRGNPRRSIRFDRARKGIRFGRVVILATADEVIDCIRYHETKKDTTDPRENTARSHINDAWTYPYYRFIEGQTSDQEPEKEPTFPIFRSAPKRSTY